LDDWRSQALLIESISARIELVDVSAQPGFRDRWSPGSAPMPILSFDDEPDDVGS